MNYEAVGVEDLCGCGPFKDNNIPTFSWINKGG
jgi:hypothetical protein